jgi:hypothetical protein
MKRKIKEITEALEDSPSLFCNGDQNCGKCSTCHKIIHPRLMDTLSTFPEPLVSLVIEFYHVPLSEQIETQLGELLKEEQESVKVAKKGRI